MQERQGSAGMSVEMPKNTMWYGVGKAVEKGVKALGPDAWRKRVLHVIDTQIIPRSNPKWQEWAKEHREDIERVAANTGVQITVVEIALGSVAALWGVKKIQRLYLNNRLEKKWGRYPPSASIDLKEIALIKNAPSERTFFQAQIVDAFSKKFGDHVARNLSDTMNVLVTSKDIFTQRDKWNTIVSQANAGHVAIALGVLERMFQQGLEVAAKKNGWAKEIPKKYRGVYAKDLLLPLWMKLPQVEALAFAQQPNTEHSVDSVLNAFEKIREYTRSQKYHKDFKKRTKMFLIHQSAKQNTTPQSLVDMGAMRKNLLYRPEKEEMPVTSALPSFIVNRVVLDHVGSLPPSKEVATIEEARVAIDSAIAREKAGRQIKNMGGLLSDQKKARFVRHETNRPIEAYAKSKKQKEKEKYSDQYSIEHDYKKEEQMSEDLQRLAKDYLGRPIKYPRLFPPHEKEVPIPPLLENTLTYIDSSRPSKIIVASSDSSLQKTDKRVVLPEHLFERIQSEVIQKAHVRETKRRIKRIAQERKDYAEKHHLK